MASPHYIKEPVFEDDYDLEEPWLDIGWYFIGEDGPDCPYGPYDTEEIAIKAQYNYINSLYKGLA